MNEENTKLRGVIIVGVIILAGLLSATGLVSITTGDAHTYDVNTFSSYEQLLDFLQSKSRSSHGSYWGLEESVRMFKGDNAVPMMADSENGYSVDYSETNIQVEGVDEPDIVKTDGTYLYIVANSKLYIVRAYPAEDAEVLSVIDLDENVYLIDIFINEDRLVIFGTSSRHSEDHDEDSYWWSVSTTVIKIYDISDRENPDLTKDVEMDGTYFDSRMIGEYIYVIAVEYSYMVYNVKDGNGTLAIPEITVNDETSQVPPNQIYYVDVPGNVDTMTHVLALNIFDEEVTQKSFLLGSSQNMYVSMNNIFLTYTKYYYTFSPVYGYNYDSEESTFIHRISISNGDVSYTGQGKVPGRILNQFSMDEHDGHFRIATTIGHVSRSGGGSTNNVYILDDTLNITGRVEDLAPGERIYSVRFMGDRGYVVTFKKVDPLFVIDLKDPDNPSVLGKLKIPGYSDYLHPFDENHIIGIGKDTVEAEEGDFAWYQGIKMALFDVSDYENPKEIAKVIIGDRGTESPALHDHKAFLFDREKELLVLPVSLYEIDEEIKEQQGDIEGNTYGEFTFQGAYVYRLSLEDGFEYQGRITHLDDEDILKSGYYGYWGSSSIQRSLYIGDVLYTISESMVKMNSLDDLSEINSLELA